MMYNWNGNWGGMVLVMLVGIAVIGVVIWAVSRLVSNQSSSGGQSGRGSSGLEVLRQRYAHGEIDAATFDEMRRRLGAGEGPPGVTG